jgi:hypothetical protein
MTPCQLVTCIDGPLAGIRVRVKPMDYKSEGALFGWAKVAAEGVIVANNVHGARPKTLRFRDYAFPGRRESGLEK